MIARDDVIALYRLILGREAESEDVINEKRRSGTVNEVAFEMLMSDEFITKNIGLLYRLTG